jgi:hypothetical protein
MLRIGRQILLLFFYFILSGWGFFAHQKINRLAVFTLPVEMIGFYKKNIQYISEAAVNPDRRRYAIPEEAPRHYIDLDEYGDSAATKLPRYWKQAVEKYGEDSLMKHGIVPWHINHHLTQVFRMRVSKRETFLPLCKACASVNLKLICKKDFNERNQLNYFSLYLIVTKRRCARLCGVG